MKVIRMECNARYSLDDGGSGGGAQEDNRNESVES